MFDITNPYTLRTETSGGITKYYVSFTDGQGAHCETEVSYAVYRELLRFCMIERNLRRWDERHIEQSEVSDEALYVRAMHKPREIDDLVFESLRNEKLRLTIQQLPKIQRRRFVLYYEFGLTYEQISAIDGCSKVAVFKSVTRAEEKIKEKLKYFYF